MHGPATRFHVLSYPAFSRMPVGFIFWAILRDERGWGVCVWGWMILRVRELLNGLSGILGLDSDIDSDSDSGIVSVIDTGDSRTEESRC